MSKPISLPHPELSPALLLFTCQPVILPLDLLSPAELGLTSLQHNPAGAADGTPRRNRWDQKGRVSWGARSPCPSRLQEQRCQKNSLNSQSKERPRGNSLDFGDVGTRCSRRPAAGLRSLCASENWTLRSRGSRTSAGLASKVFDTTRAELCRE